jgi:hypothetical protein
MDLGDVEECISSKMVLNGVCFGGMQPSAFDYFVLIAFQQYVVVYVTEGRTFHEQLWQLV